MMKVKIVRVFIAIEHDQKVLFAKTCSYMIGQPRNLTNCSPRTPATWRNIQEFVTNDAALHREWFHRLPFDNFPDSVFVASVDAVSSVVSYEFHVLTTLLLIYIHIHIHFLHVERKLRMNLQQAIQFITVSTIGLV